MKAYYLKENINQCSLNYNNINIIKLKLRNFVFNSPLESILKIELPEFIKHFMKVLPWRLHPVCGSRTNKTKSMLIQI